MRRIPPWLLAAFVVGSIALAVFGVVAFAGHVNFLISNDQNIHISVVALVYGAVISTGLFGAFTALAIEEGRAYRSRLLMPLVWATGTLYAYLLIIGGEGMDFLLHGAQRRYAWLYQPETRFFSSILLIGFLGCLAWLLAEIIIGGKGIKPRTLLIIYAVIAACVAVGIVIAVHFLN